MKKLRLNITGMSCVNCANAITRATSKLDGIKSAKVSLADNSALFEIEKGRDIDELQKTIKAKIKKLGYGVCNDYLELAKAEQSAIKSLLYKLIASVILACVVMYCSHILGFYAGLVAFLACSISVFWCGFGFLKHAFLGIRAKNYDMNVLVSLSVLCAYFYSAFVFFVPEIFAENMRYLYFDSPTMIIAFVLFGKFLEANSKQKAKDFLKTLMDLSPRTAILIGADGKEKIIDVKELKIGDVVSVKSGFNIPSDGQIISGGAQIDESSITGESLPKYKSVNDSVFAGTTNINGFINVKISKSIDNTLLAEILELLQDSGSFKLNISRLADKIANVFTPLVIALSFITFAIWSFFDLPLGIMNALCVLIISCPCALGLAAPIASVCAISQAAKQGVLIKNPSIFERFNGAKYIVFDKTGTLTNAKLSIVKSTLNDNDLRLVAGVCALSGHLISKAICENVKIYEKASGKLNELAGLGLEYENGQILIGNAKLLAKHGVIFQEPCVKNLSVLVAIDGKYRGFIALNDSIKADAKSTIQSLKALNLEPIMLTGDKQTNAKSVADELGINSFFAEVLPTQKLEKIKELQEKGGVIFVGDGINDALALAQADVSIAISSGADIAKDAGDILLIKNDLKASIYALKLCAFARKIIKQNLAWAFVYNLICIPVAAGALYPLFNLSLNPAYGAMAMSLSSVCVVLNSLRLKAFK